MSRRFKIPKRPAPNRFGRRNWHYPYYWWCCDDWYNDWDWDDEWDDDWYDDWEYLPMSQPKPVTKPKIDIKKAAINAYKKGFEDGVAYSKAQVVEATSEQSQTPKE